MVLSILPSTCRSIPIRSRVVTNMGYGNALPHRSNRPMPLMAAATTFREGALSCWFSAHGHGSHATVAVAATVAQQQQQAAQQAAAGGQVPAGGTLRPPSGGMPMPDVMTSEQAATFLQAPFTGRDGRYEAGDLSSAKDQRLIESARLT